MLPIELKCRPGAVVAGRYLDPLGANSNRQEMLAMDRH